MLSKFNFMDFIYDIFHYTFLQNAMLAAIFAGISCGIIGTYIVVRRLVFLGAGITHSSFGGIGLAYYLGLNPTIGALFFAVLSALGVNFLSRKDKLREDSAVGILWALGMALGIIFIFITPGYAPNLMSFLFGSLLTITPDVLIANGVVSLLLVALFILFGRRIVYVAFDRNFAMSQGVNVCLIENIAMVLVSVTIVLIIKLVGIVLLISLLTIAPITIGAFTTSYKHLTIYSIVLTIISSVIGIIISYYSDFPSGASIVVVLCLFYLLSRVFKGGLRCIMR